LEDIDRGIVAAPRQTPAQDDVPIEDTSHGIRDRLVHVITFYEDGVESRNTPLSLTGTGALKKSRKN
jgi:hypothetical protein